MENQEHIEKDDVDGDYKWIQIQEVVDKGGPQTRATMEEIRTLLLE